MPKPLNTEDEPHDEAEMLLPWYATGQLNPAERGLVERHLASCARCSRQLRFEHRLIEQVQELTPGLDASWAALRARLRPAPSPRESILRLAAEFWHGLSRPAVATLAVAQMAIVVFTATMTAWLNVPQYHALGTAMPAHGGNVIVMFHDTATEGGIRDALKASGASLVGGPTSADAYLLYVPSDRRQAALAKLRSNQNVEMAEPLDEASR